MLFDGYLGSLGHLKPVLNLELSAVLLQRLLDVLNLLS